MIASVSVINNGNITLTHCKNMTAGNILIGIYEKLREDSCSQDIC